MYAWGRLAHRVAVCMMGFASFAGQAAAQTAADAGAPADDEVSTEDPDAEEEPTAPPNVVPAPPSPEQLAAEQAKQLFLQGNELRKAGDFERALVLYEKSRALLPRVPNTINSAYCLSQIGRYDEALERYEEVLTQYRDELTEEDRRQIAPEVTALRRKVGSVDVAADVQGATLVVDGRPRGHLPLLTPVRVLPGDRLIQVMADGYRTHQQTVAVSVGQTANLSVRLEPLAVSGRARVDDPALAGADVFIDGAPVGQVPYDGGLEPGRHWYVVRKGDVGSAPRDFVVVKGQKVLLEPETGPLGREIVVQVTPSSAGLRIDDVALGSRWRGRLPVGPHVVTASEEGYLDGRQILDIPAGGGEDMTLTLAIDERHPRWGAEDPGRLWIDAVGALATAPSLGSRTERTCSNGEARCAANPIALGFDLGARAGYELPFGLSIEIEGGYLSVSKTVERTIQQIFAAGSTAAPSYHEARYTIRDRLSVAGPHVGGGLGYTLELGDRWELRGHLLVGAWFTRARDDARATATGSGGTVDASMENTNTASTRVSLLVRPAIAMSVDLDVVRLGVGVAVPVVATGGPTFDNGELAVRAPTGDRCVTDPGHVSCAPGTRALASETAYGTFAILQPELTVGYVF